MKAITIEDIVAEIRKLPATQGLTRREITERLKCSEKKGVETIREAIAKGLMKFVGHRADTRIDGVPCRTPIYQITKKKR